MNEVEDLQPKKVAAQGLIALWEVVDWVCAEFGWNWTKECRSTSYCQVYARPEDMLEWQVGILFNAAASGKPQLFPNADRKEPLTAIQRAEARSFIDAVEGRLFVGLGYGNPEEYSDSDFKRLLSNLALEKTTDVTAQQLQAERDEKTITNVSAASNTLEEKAVDELRTALLAMGYPADRVEWAIKEHRREQEMVRYSRLDGKTNETQYLEGLFIEPTTEIYPGVLSQERDGVVTNRLLARLISLIENLSAGIQDMGEGYWPGLLSSTARKQKPRKGGRPRNADDDWAYEQVRLYGRSRKEVYVEWLERIGVRAKSLADPRDSFNKIFVNRDGDEKEKTD